MEHLISSMGNRAALFEKMSKDGQLLSQIEQVGRLLKTALLQGSIVLVCGNGGSAAEAQHMSGEIIGRFMVERDGLPTIALAGDIATLTAVGNDYGFDEIYARQVSTFKGLASVLVMLSTSGNSSNLVKAAWVAKNCGIKTVGFLGKDGGALMPLCDYAILIPSWSTPEIQEAHLTVIHLLCEYVDGVRQ